MVDEVTEQPKLSFKESRREGVYKKRSREERTPLPTEVNLRVSSSSHEKGESGFSPSPLSLWREFFLSPLPSSSLPRRLSRLPKPFWLEGSVVRLSLRQRGYAQKPFQALLGWP